MLSDWVSFLAYLNLFEIEGFVVVVVMVRQYVFCRVFGFLCHLLLICACILKINAPHCDV
jgi:hypothetical protein